MDKITKDKMVEANFPAKETETQRGETNKMITMTKMIPTRMMTAKTMTTMKSTIVRKRMMIWRIWSMPAISIKKNRSRATYSSEEIKKT